MKETKQMDKQEEQPNKREIPLEKLTKRAFPFSFLDDDDVTIKTNKTLSHL